MLGKGVIESNESPWRVQILIISSDNSQKCLVIDYSQTVHRFTKLDAYSLSRNYEMGNEIAKYPERIPLSRTQARRLTVYSL